MIQQGLQLMIVGMTVVVLFLTILVATLSLSALLFAGDAQRSAAEKESVFSAIAAAAAFDRDQRRSEDDAES